MQGSEQELIIVSGLPASGKSTFSRRLAARTGYRILTSDEIRYEFFPDDIPAQTRYSEWSHAIVFEIMYLRAELEILHRGGVILDGMHFHPRGWQRVREIAETSGASVYFIQLIADYDTLKSRIKERNDDPYLSGANIDVLNRYWSRIQDREVEYPTRVEKFRKLGFSWYEVDAVSLKVLDKSGELPAWILTFTV